MKHANHLYANACEIVNLLPLLLFLVLLFVAFDRVNFHKISLVPLPPSSREVEDHAAERHVPEFVLHWKATENQAQTAQIVDQMQPGILTGPCCLLRQFGPAKTS